MSLSRIPGSFGFFECRKHSENRHHKEIGKFINRDAGDIDYLLLNVYSGQNRRLNGMPPDMKKGMACKGHPRSA
ncbi:hypothetical protein [Delftia sp. CH05]|uniref:hypothetical protein n=1 Tax=Delftia sp. CH05 TaxID=2692194 RepID=UPI00135D181C|nr:hypothetical protein [Delftia sp. CH05]MXN32377.1 hypothetical protein [Delftia sp. CH05]